MKKTSIKGEDYQKYYKQLILKKIGVIGQKKIFNSKVLVVGAGGLGCPLILYLAYSGVGNIGIVDHDIIEISNLSRQILFTKKDIGKKKVLIAKQMIKNINSKISVDIYKNKIDIDNIKKIGKNYSIICDGTDNFKTRYLINDYCVKNKKILISAAINKFDGQLFNFDFRNKTACFRCFMPEIPNNEVNCQTDGIMTTLAGVAGSLQANEVIKSILDIKNKKKGNVMIFNSLNSDFRVVKLLKNPDCKNKNLHG
ncbi:MAG: molybdopterin biosynthesis protein [Candidatus Pelagibacter sp. TMED196]|nr:MAG: molybdopterin biosynthesis protein [Candidatus Pelagibacter sp. TMED196]|tara:strand:- start:1735 stop:2496 length:762 start_codon:yes stop_codon:yes gene_type:complete